MNLPDEHVQCRLAHLGQPDQPNLFVDRGPMERLREPAQDAGNRLAHPHSMQTGGQAAKVTRRPGDIVGHGDGRHVLRRWTIDA
jgi:hypothetical protein